MLAQAVRGCQKQLAGPSHLGFGLDCLPSILGFVAKLGSAGSSAAQRVTRERTGLGLPAPFLQLQARADQRRSLQCCCCSGHPAVSG